MKLNIGKLFYFILICLLFVFTNTLYAKDQTRLLNLIGTNDSLLAADSHGKILISKNAGKKLLPASTLKVLTSLIARHYLKSDHRFITEFYMDNSGSLKIKGYGDPLLISEIIPEIAKKLKTKIDNFNDLILDDSYFDPVTIPGVTSTLNPYDSPVGALCVNFNTVNFKRVQGKYISAEPQTPLLDFVINRVRKSGLNQERIVLSSINNETVLYAGHMFKYFFQNQGISSTGTIKTGRVFHETDKLVLRYQSSFSLDQVIEKLLGYSNNFIANQLFIKAGIENSGPPGNLEKGRMAASDYIKNILKIDDLYMDEGSGISRKNKISCVQMLKVLQEFKPWHKLMKQKGRTFYKTGGLSGVKTRAGYIQNKDGSLYPFVVMLNTSGKRTETIMNLLDKII
ncbi:Peptidase, S16 family [Desulfonema limicola]|uniref:Peptidase, S16 family n=1 Tax=Desulfonema limicola TaxID=45656 RepID=A0A975B8Y7_9BACT|nr:D-alanyl-D-alanine carboxypeptidase [Desulfonema limicola]QTA80980.1 Peptidase, S16 family [Desulfonema limicola]